MKKILLIAIISLSTVIAIAGPDPLIYEENNNKIDKEEPSETKERFTGTFEISHLRSLWQICFQENARRGTSPPICVEICDCFIDGMREKYKYLEVRKGDKRAELSMVAAECVKTIMMRPQEMAPSSSALY